MITATDINKSYGDLHVLKDVSVSIEKGEVVSIVGPSGAGKTTLLQILGTLDRPDSGSLHYGDTDVFGLKERELARFRNEHIGFVFMKVDHRASHKPKAMSGGEQQRVAVARALVNNPMAVLADEPSGNLDTAHARELHELFFRLRDQYNQTFVIVTHNEELASMADRKITIIDGKSSE